MSTSDEPPRRSPSRDDAPSFGGKGEVVARLLALCERLRGPGGCAWDREQTLETLTPYLREEAYEVTDAVAGGDHAEIRGELGDLLFVTIFAIHAAEVEGVARMEDIVDTVVEKLIRRHPHVFGPDKSQDPKEARARWQRAKQDEAPAGSASLLGEVEPARPPIVTAYRTQEKAAAVGFDWKTVADTIHKVDEELEELRAVIQENAGLEASAARRRRLTEEMGDVLFACVNVARKLAIDPDQALSATTRRFHARFRYIERALAAAGKTPETSTLEEMDRLWNEAKGRP